MEIIHHGNLDKLVGKKRFVCDECGCDFLAYPGEYMSKGKDVDIKYTCKCPDCGAACERDREMAKLEAVVN